MKDELYQFKITLNGSTPPIWRRFVVNNDMTLFEFHEIIQHVMGWENYHFYSFQVGKQMMVMPEMDLSSFGEDAVFANELCLHDVLKRVGQKIIYTYDFGDDWQHDIVFEKRLPAKDPDDFPVCIEGEMPCPPEECGGMCDYYMQIESGDLEDRGTFDLDEVNKNLRQRE